jgi:hypothetical protein
MKQLFPILAIIFFAVVLRLIPHPPNVAPIAALALFGGVYLDKKYALVIPLLAMFVADLFLGFHASMPAVYISFLLTGLIGIWVKKRKSLVTVFGATLVSSTLFFLLTNFNYWLSSSLYPKTLSGQIEAYYYALPFFRNTVLGDMLYTSIFFGTYELVLRTMRIKQPALTKA